MKDTIIHWWDCVNPKRREEKETKEEKEREKTKTVF